MTKTRVSRGVIPLVGATPRRPLAATLIAYGALPELADDFVLFLAVAERCEAMLEESGLDARIQPATFHPVHRFERRGDPGSGGVSPTGPYPTMHLLRVVDVSRAIDGFEGNTEDIPAANVEVLRDVGLGAQLLAKRLEGPRRVESRREGQGRRLLEEGVKRFRG